MTYSAINDNKPAYQSGADDRKGMTENRQNAIEACLSARIDEFQHKIGRAQSHEDIAYMATLSDLITALRAQQKRSA